MGWVVLHLWWMGAKGTRMLTTWVRLVPNKPETIGFASILSIGKDATQKSWKCHIKGKSKKRAGVATVSVGVSIQLYMPIKLLSSREAHLKMIAVGLQAANAILPSSLCVNPMLTLVATLAIFRAMLDNPSVAL